MNRRDFLCSTSIAFAGFTLTKAELSFAQQSPSEGWHRFEVTTSAEVLKPAGETRVWLPAALIQNTPFQRTMSNHFSANSGTASMVKSKPNALGIVVATFPPGAKPVLTFVSQVSLKNYSVDLSKPGNTRPASQAALPYFLQPTTHILAAGIVKAKATEITKVATTDVEKARAIYEWI